MEDEPPEEPDLCMAKLLMLVEAHNVATFLVVAPLGARHNGIDVECGYILTRLLDAHHARPLRANDVAILAERGMTAIGHEDGVLAWNEPGNRTRYYRDFTRLGVPLKRWESLAAMEAHALSAALEHLTRHPTSGKRAINVEEVARFTARRASEPAP